METLVPLGEQSRTGHWAVCLGADKPKNKTLGNNRIGGCMGDSDSRANPRHGPTPVSKQRNAPGTDQTEPPGRQPQRSSAGNAQDELSLCGFREVPSSSSRLETKSGTTNTKAHLCDLRVCKTDQPRVRHIHSHGIHMEAISLTSTPRCAVCHYGSLNTSKSDITVMFINSCQFMMAVDPILTLIQYSNTDLLVYMTRDASDTRIDGCFPVGGIIPYSP